MSKLRRRVRLRDALLGRVARTVIDRRGSPAASKTPTKLQCADCRSEFAPDPRAASADDAAAREIVARREIRAVLEASGKHDRPCNTFARRHAEEPGAGPRGGAEARSNRPRRGGHLRLHKARRRADMPANAKMRGCRVLHVRAHYVPRFYLKNFGDEIYLYDKTMGGVRKSNPRDIALEKDFYGSSDTARQLESAMCALEGKASAAIKKILQTMDYSRLSDGEKSAFCSFVALQHLRTPEKRARAVQLRHVLLDALAEQAGIDDFTIRLTEEGEKLAHLASMGDAARIASILAKMGAAVGSNATNVPLWTSDNPVNLCNGLAQPSGNLGFAPRGIEVHVPLSPTLAVVLFDPTTYAPNRMPDFFLMEKGHVIRANHLQTLQSNRFVFSNTARFFMARRYLESSPESSDADRARIGAGIPETTPEGSAGRKFRKRPEYWIHLSQCDDAGA